MLLCWNKDRTKRPCMVEISDQLKKWICSPDLMKTTDTVDTGVTKKYDFFHLTFDTFDNNNYRQ